jgi:hypothetical protein
MERSEATGRWCRPSWCWATSSSTRATTTGSTHSTRLASSTLRYGPQRRQVPHAQYVCEYREKIVEIVGRRRDCPENHSREHVIDMIHYNYLTIIYLTYNIFNSSSNQHMTHQQLNSFTIYYLPHHHSWYIKFKMINLTHIISILNSVFIIMFYVMR